MKAGQIYRITASDGRYTIGHATSLAAITLAAFGYFAMFTALRRLNNKRDNMTPEERQAELDEGKNGDRHPDFRYVL